MFFYNFNFKGRGHEFKFYFPRRWNSFKFYFNERFLENNGWQGELYVCMFDLFAKSVACIFNFVLEYRLVWMAFVRKRGSYSRIQFYEGFDTTKVFKISESVFNFTKYRRLDLNGVAVVNGFGFSSWERSLLDRLSAKPFVFNFDGLLVSEPVILQRALWKPYYTYVYFTRRACSFFVLTESPWPFYAAFSVFTLLVGFSSYFSYYDGGLELIGFGIGLIIATFFFGCRDVIRELNSFHRTSILLLNNIKLGFWLFIVSEAFLFVSFFWAFFHMALEPSFQIGSLWPPVEAIQMDSLLVPTMNTLFLLASGASFTGVQYHVVAKLYYQVIYGFIVTLIFAGFFLACQWHEYVVSAHQLNDSVFGSTLYMLTAFHGGHVIIGTIFIFVCFLRYLSRQFGWTDPVGITLAAWYWHFVDVVWLIVFVWVYLGGTWIPAELDVIFQSGFGL